MMEFAIYEQLLLTLFILISAIKFIRDLLAHINPIFKGKKDRNRTDQLGKRIWVTTKEVLFQTKVVQGRPVAGLMHAAVFGGFVFFALETADHFLKPYGLHLMNAIFGEATFIYKNIVSIWAILVAIGIAGLALRRFVFVKYSPDPKSYSSGYVALLIFLLMGTYLFTQMNTYDNATALAKSNWWLHAGIILIFPHLIIRSKHFHLLIGPVNIFFRTHHLADLTPLNLDIEALEAESDEEPTFGLETMAEVPQKMRMDFLSCVECRRCTDHCPANLSEQVLDPRGFILAGRTALFESKDDDPFIGTVISEEALGQCTSCGACEDACPVGIEHLQLLTGAKRAQAMALGTGVVASEFFETVERSGNAFGGKKKDRKALIEELEIPYYTPGETEYLMWMGCVWNYNVDAREALASFVKVLKASNTNFGVLKTEYCSGHHQRRQGEEMQFQDLAGKNMQAMQGVENIISPCPHCLHTIGREYPTLDPAFKPNVVHHSQFIQKIIAEGKLNLKKNSNGTTKTTYHDPCYLGRYEGEYVAPRELIRKAGYNITEMERSGERAMCCGGGSAGFVREQKVEKRVDQTRKDHVRDSGAKLLVTACPECKMMLNSAAEETKDIAQVVAESIE